MPKQKKSLTHNLEVDRIEYEEQLRKIKEDSGYTEEKKSDIPYLECIFCCHIQHELHSKDPTSAWCERCGKAFMAVWK